MHDAPQAEDAPGSAAGGRSRRTLRVIAVVLLAIYVLQLATPLRLDGDAVVYLEAARSLVDGEGYSYDGGPVKYPPGLPVVLAGLDALGIADAWSLVLLQLLCLAGACALMHRLLTRAGLQPAHAGAAVAAFCLSFLVPKHVTMPLSEFLFLLLSLGCLVLLQEAEAAAGPRRWTHLAGSAALAAAAISTRTIGVALLPALLWAALGSRRLDVWTFLLRTTRGRAIAAVGLVMAGLLGVVLLSSRYADEAGAVYAERGGPWALLWILRERLGEFGELALNMPRSKVPGPPWLTSTGMIVVGAVLFLALARWLWRRRTRLASHDVYFIAYAAVMWVWPYGDARFWIPVLPLMAGAIVPLLLTPWPSTRLRASARAYVAVFALVGLAALAYTTRLSWSGDDFPLRYGHGVTRATYQAAYGLPVDGEARPDPVAVRLLRRYDPGRANGQRP